MFSLSNRPTALRVWCLLFVWMLTGVAARAASVSTPDGAEAVLIKADRIKTSEHAEFAALLKQLDNGTMELDPEQKLHLRYLKAWQVAYFGDYAAAIPELNAVIGQSTDPTLRFRAGLTAVNLLGIAARYVDAFSYLNQLLEQLPQVTAPDVRVQALGTASQLYIEAGQFDLATAYADQLISESAGDDDACKGRYLKTEALYQAGKPQVGIEQFENVIALCNAAHEPIFSNGMLAHMASFHIQHGQVRAAIASLEKSYADVKRIGYVRLVSKFDALLALAYWKQGKLMQAQSYAEDAVKNSVKNEYTEPLSGAYRVLYMLAKQQGDLVAALSWHEKYMAADKGYLNDVSAKALAYQTVKQQVLAKKLQVDALNKENRILQLQHELNQKAVETSRLWIILLLSLLAFIAFLTYRIKRSQLSFMRLARRDGLTGIYNRQHFVAEAERQLEYCKKSSREACLVLIDLDHFKVVNDTFGHATGDRVLKRAVEACQKYLRSTDVFGRLGGEEFGILLPECSLEQVSARVEVLRFAVASVAMEDEFDVQVSGSFGIAATESSGYELRELLINADDALYQAKHDGRNRAVVFDASKAAPKSQQSKSHSGDAMTELHDHA